MKAYKLFRKRKNGTLGPLFINRKLVVERNKWLKAEPHKTKGFAFRPGWHCCSKPAAPHLSMKDRAWCEVEIREVKNIQRPESQGGLWYLANKLKLIKQL